jgi:hypothetical protein
LAVASSTALVFLNQFRESVEFLYGTPLLNYHLHKHYLSELTKSMNWTRLVHFSLEELSFGSKRDPLADAFGPRLPYSDLGQFLLKFFRAVSAGFLA